MADVATARVDAIAAGGAGVARVEGFVVFVQRTAPGDLAEIAYTRRGRFAEGRLRHLVEPSPLRTTPSCRHYDRDRCGGCQLQHLAYEPQLEAKRRIVGDAFARIAKRPVDVPAVTPSPTQWEYRNKLTLAMRQAGGQWTIGLHAWDDVDHVFQLEECPITHPAVVDGWREVFMSVAMLPKGDELRGAVRLADNGLSFVVDGGSAWPDAGEFAERCPSFVHIRWQSVAGESRVMTDRRTHEAPAASFEQVNPLVAAEMHAYVLERVRSYAPSTVVDAYAGAGATAIAIASAGVRVVAIEVDREASAYAARRLPPPSRVITGRVEEQIVRALPADLVILNPPRTGVDAAVCAALERFPRPRTIVYVSCNPATLARDVARLPSYRVAKVQSFDMFPQTAHVESVCELVSEAS